jgi:hypothetical protein
MDQFSRSDSLSPPHQNRKKAGKIERSQVMSDKRLVGGEKEPNRIDRIHWRLDSCKRKSGWVKQQTP